MQKSENFHTDPKMVCPCLTLTDLLKSPFSSRTDIGLFRTRKPVGRPTFCYCELCGMNCELCLLALDKLPPVHLSIWQSPNSPDVRIRPCLKTLEPFPSQVLLTARGKQAFSKLVPRECWVTKSNFQGAYIALLSQLRCKK